MNLSDSHRLTTLEEKFSGLSKSHDDEKKETRAYRETLQGKIEALSRVVYVGMGIVIALQFIAPLVISALKATH